MANEKSSSDSDSGAGFRLIPLGAGKTPDGPGDTGDGLMSRRGLLGEGAPSASRWARRFRQMVDFGLQEEEMERERCQKPVKKTYHSAVSKNCSS